MRNIFTNTGSFIFMKNDGIVLTINLNSGFTSNNVLSFCNFVLTSGYSFSISPMLEYESNSSVSIYAS